jgi:hypothetical protein
MGNRIRPVVMRGPLGLRAQQPLASGWQPLARHVTLREMQGVPTSPLPLVSQQSAAPPTTKAEADADAAWAALRALRGTRPPAVQPQAPPVIPSAPQSVPSAVQRAPVESAQPAPTEPPAFPHPAAAKTAGPTTQSQKTTAQPESGATEKGSPRPPARRTQVQRTVESPAEPPTVSQVPHQVASAPPTLQRQPVPDPSAVVPTSILPQSARQETPTAQAIEISPPARMPETPPDTEPPSWSAAESPAQPEPIASPSELATSSLPLTRSATPAGPPRPIQPAASELGPAPIPPARPTTASTPPAPAQPAVPKPGPTSAPLVQPRRLVAPHQPLGQRFLPSRVQRAPVTLGAEQLSVPGPPVHRQFQPAETASIAASEPPIEPSPPVGERAQRVDAEPAGESRPSAQPGRGPAELARRTFLRHRQSAGSAPTEPFDGIHSEPSQRGSQETQPRPLSRTVRRSPAEPSDQEPDEVSPQRLVRPTSSEEAILPETVRVPTGLRAKDPARAVEPEATIHPRPVRPSVQRAPIRREDVPQPTAPIALPLTGKRRAHVPGQSQPKALPASTFTPPPLSLPAGEPPFEMPLLRESAPRPAIATAQPGPAVVQRTVSNSQDLRQALQPTLVPTVVQATPETPAAGSAPGAEEGKSEEERQDLESLAREVYHLVRRRLAIERERERGRW